MYALYYSSVWPSPHTTSRSAARRSSMQHDSQLNLHAHAEFVPQRKQQCTHIRYLSLQKSTDYWKPQPSAISIVCGGSYSSSPWDNLFFSLFLTFQLRKMASNLDAILWIIERADGERNIAQNYSPSTKWFWINWIVSWMERKKSERRKRMSVWREKLVKKKNENREEKEASRLKWPICGDFLSSSDIPLTSPHHQHRQQPACIQSS